MNLLTPRERERYIREMKNILRINTAGEVSVVLCPPFVHLEAFAKSFEKYAAIGAQDVSWERKGALTGEVSAPMAHAFGAVYAIVGHSERRSMLGETNDMVSRKAYQACVEGMRTILCVGETQENRRDGTARGVVSQQLVESLREFPKDKSHTLCVAYEPVWAIGSGQTPSVEDIIETRNAILETLSSVFGSDLGRKIPILYGGSVSSQNIHAVGIESGMNGVLLGSASLHADEFSRILDFLKK